MKAAKKGKLSKPPEFFAALIRSNYFPRELPPAITTRTYAEFCKTNYSFLKTAQSGLISKTTNYETFTAPRTGVGRRNLALVHPLSQAGLSLLITQHRTKIRKIISESGTSLYRTEENMAASKAFLGLDFQKWRNAKASTYSEYQFVLQADISRFFYTVYTHSIPWSIIGKDKVKAWLATKKKKKLDAHWSNGFDVALQSCQSRETFGIPVGPDTSRLIAELLLAGIEKDKDLQSFLTTQPAFRLVDDLIVGFEDESNARKCLGALRRALWKFNLQLNDEKTAVLPSRAIFREKWEFEHNAIVVSDVDVAKQEGDIYRLIDLTLRYCAEQKSDCPAIWTCTRLGRLKTVGPNFAIILDALFRLSLEFPRCTSHVAGFVINHQLLCVGPSKQRTLRWIKAMLKLHLPHGHDFEVSWCFVVCGVLKFVIGKDDLPSTKSMPNAIVFAMLGLLHEKGLLALPLSAWPWRAYLKKRGIYSEGWLPFFEAVRRKWTKDKKLIGAIKSDPILSKMLTEGVTFLEDQIFDAKNVDVARRVFSKVAVSIAAPKVKAKAKVSGFGDIVLTPSDFEY
jgi:hypothetical protein